MELQLSYWYVAHTRYFRGELKVRDLLASFGIETFVPTVTRKKTRGSGTHEIAVVPNIVFLRVTKLEAMDLVNIHHLPMRYAIDSATHSMMKVRDKEMEDFRRVFANGCEEGIGLVSPSLNLGERVRVTHGTLQGVEGNVLELHGRLYVVVSLIGLMFARTLVPRCYLEKVQ